MTELVTWFAERPLELRLIVVAVAGCLAATQVNRGVYRLAFGRRWIGPWSAPDPTAPPRRPWDRLPIVGWIGLRRESIVHGKRYWIRPMLIELAFTLGLPALYWWEVDQAGLLPNLPGLNGSPLVLHTWFFGHSVLACLLTIATFIDFDERTIPDAVTLPGTLFALILVSLAAHLLPPDFTYEPTTATFALTPLLAAPAQDWPRAWDESEGLRTGLIIWCCFVLAISPRSRFTIRRGVFKAVQYQVVSTYRYGSWRYVALAAAGLIGIATVWSVGPPAWRGLLTSLHGLAYGGGLIWLVRIVAGIALRQEAMGFGDVTLMAMIGAFLGWQATIIVFFLAPFAAVIISVVRFLTSRDRHIAFGPYLALAAFFCVIAWQDVWFEQFRGVFNALGSLISPMLLVAIAAMGPVADPGASHHTGVGGFVPHKHQVKKKPNGIDRGGHGEPQRRMQFCPLCSSVLSVVTRLTARLELDASAKNQEPGTKPLWTFSGGFSTVRGPGAGSMVCGRCGLVSWSLVLLWFMARIRWQDTLPLALAAAVLLAALTPLPTWMMDIAVAANLTLAVLLLFTVLRVRSPFQLSAFPAILVAATMGRLALNLASTRLILSQGDTRNLDAAGGMIRAFGEFVAGDDLIVGLVMFAIILIVQFVVITKGAERVSEVAARFALDALPGRQAAIEADVASGAIDELTARRRRRDLARQADFHGAMDGASKFVRGDAIAGLIITMINLLGGWARGSFSGAMSWDEAWGVYAKLAIGDGLASQTPAVLVAVAAAFLVTSNGHRSPLATTLGRQITACPEAWIGAAVLLLVLLFTELPKAPLAVLAVACLAAGWWISTRQQARSGPPRANRDRPPAAASLAPAAPLMASASSPATPRTQAAWELALGRGLVRLAEGQGAADLLPRLTELREQLTLRWGLRFPPIRVRDERELPPDVYCIRVHGDALAESRLPKGLLVRRARAVMWDAALDEVAGPAWRHAAVSDPIHIAPPTLADEFQRAGCELLTPVDLLIEHVRQTAEGFADELLGRDTMRAMVEDFLSEEGESWRQDLRPAGDRWGVLHQVLVLLLRERVPIRQLDVVLAALSDGGSNATPRQIAEECRRRLARTICSQYWTSRKQLSVAVLAPRWERALLERHAEQDIPPETLQWQIEELDGLRRQTELAAQECASTWVLLAPAKLRPGLRRVMESTAPHIAVLSHHEIPRDARLQTVLVLDDPGKATRSQEPLSRPQRETLGAA